MAVTLQPTNQISNQDQEIPLVPIRDVVVFPYTEPVLTFGRPKSVAAVEAADKGTHKLALVAQRDAKVSEPAPEDLFNVGVLVEIQKVLTIEGVIHALVKGIHRIRIDNI